MEMSKRIRVLRVVDDDSESPYKIVMTVFVSLS